MATLQTKIKNETKEALRAKDTLRLLVLRGLLSEFINTLVSQKRKPSEEISDEDALQVINRAAKQRKDSIEQFTKGGRQDLVEKEEAELVILEEYLPKMMDKDDIQKLAKAKKDELGIVDKSDIGKLMGAIMSELKGKADGNTVKEVVSSLFD